MKKFLPFVFPTAAVLIVLILAVRWYRLGQQPEGQITPFAEGVEIENMTSQEARTMLQGVSDLETVVLKGEEQGQEELGYVRYEVVDGKVRLSVMASVADPEPGSHYQVWLKAMTSDGLKKAFVLEMSKGGYLGSAVVAADILPFEVVVSTEQVDDDQIESVLMKGTVVNKE